jgi:flagellar M-ring protein FliF
MDFLNQSFAQLKDLFEGMTSGSRITAGLLLVVVVVSLGYLFTHTVPGNSVYLLDGRSFSNSELDAIEAALGEAGFKCETDGSRIRVPRGKKYVYMAALLKAGALPKDFGEDLRSTLANQSVFGNWKLTKEQLKASTLREMGKIISAIPAVENATVQSAREEGEGWLRNDVVTASVNVWMLGSKQLDQDLVNAICGTIMGSIGGLKPENITVIDSTRGLTFYGNAEDLAGGAGGSYATVTQDWRKYYRDNILESLQDIPGVTVSCNVILSKEKSHVEESIDHDPKKLITLQNNEKTLTRSYEGAEPAGRPGPVGQANTARSLGNSQGRGAKEDAEESETEQTSISSKSTQTKTELAGLVPERVSVSINVPSTHIEDIWHKINDTAGEEPKNPDENELAQLQQAEVAKIETIVAPLLPEVQGVDDLTDLVEVRVFYPIAMAPIPDPSMTESALVWLGQSWQTLGLIVLAFFSLLMIRSMVKSVPGVGVAEAPAGRSGSGPVSEEEDKLAEQPDAPRLVRFGTSGQSLKDELADLVTEDPDAAANVLKNWIGHVSNAA